MTAASATDLQRPADLEPRFAAVYLEHVDYVWTNLRRLGVPWTELDDAVQETFIVAFRRWDDFDSQLQWRSWLFGIARRVASHHRRGSGRRLRLVEAVNREPAPPLGTAPQDPDDAVAHKDAARLVQHFLETLSPRRREVFILAELEGMTGASIADALGIPANTVWSRLRAGRESFERYLQTLRARERGATERLDRAALMRDVRQQRAPADKRRTMMAAVAVELSLPSSAGTAGIASAAVTTGWLAALKPAAIAIAIAAGTLASIGAGARMLDADETKAPPAASVTAPQSQATASPKPAPPGPGPKRVEPAPEPATVEPASPAVPSPATDPTPRPAAKRSTNTHNLQAELALLAQMRDAAPAKVLELAAEHRRAFPRGELTVERDLLRVVALCRLGREEPARKALLQYRRRGTPLPAPVAEACASVEEKPTKPERPGQ